MNNIKSQSILILILIFAIILRLLFFIGVTSSDDLGYYDFAYKVTKNSFMHSSNFHSTRIGLIYPTALSYKLFGINEYISNLLPLITSLLSITLTFYIGKFFFGEKTGLLAAFLLSFYPVHVSYATILFPDLPSAFFVALGVYIFLKAEKTESKINYLISGISIGVAYLMKELSVLIFSFFIIYVIYKKILKKEHFLIFLGFLIIFSFEMFYYMSQNLNPLFRYTSVESQAVDIIKTYYYNYFGAHIWSRLFLHYPYVLLMDIEARYFYILFFISILYFIINKKKETYPLLFWIIPIVLYLNFGSNSFSEYVPLVVGTRYLDFITIPSIILLAYFLSQKKISNKKILVPLILIFLLSTSIFAMVVGDKRLSTQNLRKAKYYIESKPQKIIYVDWRTNDILRYLFNYERNDIIVPYNEYVVLNLKQNEKNILLNMKNINDSYVIIDKKMIKALSNYKDMKFPQEIYDPPQNWVLEKTFGEGEDKLFIYYIP